MKYCIDSCAKVNLTLDVSERRKDGFHDIKSIMQSISLCDRITLTTGGGGIHVSCNLPWVPRDTDNLAGKAAALFFEAVKKPAEVTIEIEKQIPGQAGLGGGSSNAAAVILALNHMFDSPLGDSGLCEIAARVGSDVPFFLFGGMALVSGRGDKIQPIADIDTWWLLIVKPPFGVSTPWAYKRLDEMQRGEQTDHTARMLKCIEHEECRELPKLLANDLEAPAIERHPEIATIKARLLACGARGALMCGSGSAVFGLFESAEEASACDMSDCGAVHVAKTLKGRTVERL